jgi:uncharacterized protein (TIGR03067 family)
MGALPQAVAGCFIALLSCGLIGCNASGKTDSAGCRIDPAEDARQWQGTWKLVSATWNGEPQKSDVRWLVDGDRYTVRHNGTDVEHNPFKLDACEKHIDVFHHEVPKGAFGGSLKGIYEIKGDRLQVCYDPTARRYPKSFEARSGSKLVLYEFQRESR